MTLPKHPERDPQREGNHANRHTPVEPAVVEKDTPRQSVSHQSASQPAVAQFAED